MCMVGGWTGVWGFVGTTTTTDDPFCGIGERFRYRYEHPGWFYGHPEK
jgi:hypothetical protein